MKKKSFILSQSTLSIILLLLVIFFINGCDFFSLNQNTNTNNNNLKVIEFETISQGLYSGLEEQGRYIIKNNNDWKNFWQKVNINQISPSPLPPINFNEDMIIAVALGKKNTGGYNIEITNVLETPIKLIIKVKITKPTQKKIVTQALTYPYHIIKIKKINKKVEFLTE